MSRPLRLGRLSLSAALLCGALGVSIVPGAGCDSSTRVADDAAAEPTTADDEATAPTRRTDLARFTAGIGGKGVLTATIHTSLGAIRCQLYEERAPATVANFVGLARGMKAWVDPETGQPVHGQPLYEDLPFHRVVPGFLVQTGDPSGDGRGGPGYAIEDEFHDELDHSRAGTLSMANRSRPDTGGSQFFITERAAPHLDGRHTVFGRCVDLDVIRSIARVPAGPDSRPRDPPIMESITLSRGSFP